VPLAALVDNVPLVGRPPAMALRGGCVAAIYAVKVTKRHRLYPADRVKLYAYGMLAEETGAACPGMKLVMVTAEEPLGLRELLTLVPTPEEPRPTKGETVSIHVLAHDEHTERETLAPLLAYWRSEKPPRPRPGPWCRGCPFRERCQATL